MQIIPKTLLSGYLVLTTLFTFIYFSSSKQILKSFFGRNYNKSIFVTPKLSRDNDKKWANEILNGGYILYFRHTEYSKGIDGNLYDALEASDDLRLGEKDYFKNQVCLSKKGEVQAKAINEVINYSKLPIGFVVSSPICRARQTAELAFGGYQKIDKNIIYNSLFSQKNKISLLRKFLTELPIYKNTNTIVSGHNSTVDCKIFTNKYCHLLLGQGGFYVIKKENGNLKLVYEFHNFSNFSRVFYKKR